MMSCDIDCILQCAKLSSVAYCDTLPMLDDHVIPITFIEERCWIFKGENVLYIVFRGSDSINDIADNFKILMRDFNNCGKIHGGYYEHYLHVRDAIKPIISQFTSLEKIVVTGHSMGGACAVLASLDLTTEFPVEIICVTFGAPPMADRSFVSCHEEKVSTFRVVIPEDWAPKLPMPCMHHVGHPVILTQNPQPGKVIGSHRMSHYVECIEKQCKKSTPPMCHMRVARNSIVKTIKRLPPDAMHIPRII